MVFLRGCGAIKVTGSFFKYMPQVLFNLQRKSTKGFSATGMALDFVGGMFSIAQQFLTSFLLDSWAPFTYNLAKTFLALETLMFDTILLSQHFVYTVAPQYRGNIGPRDSLPFGTSQSKSEGDLAALIPRSRPSSTED